MRLTAYRDVVVEEEEKHRLVGGGEREDNPNRSKVPATT